MTGETEHSFEQDLMRTIQQRIVAMAGAVNSGLIRGPDYDAQIKIPRGVMDAIYASIKWDDVLALIKPQIAQIVADRIVVAMTTELTGDVKKVMSSQETRTKLRGLVMEGLGLNGAANT